MRRCTGKPSPVYDFQCIARSTLILKHWAPNVSVSTVSELYIENRKRGKVFLYIFASSLVSRVAAVGVAPGIHLYDETVAARARCKEPANSTGQRNLSSAAYNS